MAQVAQVRVPTAQGDHRDPNLDVPSPEEGKACQVPSLREDVSSHLGAEDASTPSRLEEAASGRDEAPSPAVLSVPNREAEVLLAPIPQAAVAPILQEAEGPNLPGAEVPIHPVVEAIHQAAGAPNLQAEEGSSPAYPCRTEVRLYRAAPWADGPALVPFLAPFGPWTKKAQTRGETVALPRALQGSTKLN